jgi:enoyl-CoA hydratase
MSYQNILFGAEGRVGIITFNRPDKLNALNREMFSEIVDVLKKVKNDSEIRVLIMTGQGRAFIAGADIQIFTTLTAVTAREFAQGAHDLAFQLEALDIPVIAAVNGFALGGGLEMALACDVIYAADSARFGHPETNLGIIPGFGGTQRLARLVGKGLAKELILTGRVIDAAEARALGLVAQIFPAASLVEETLKVARSLAQKSRVALRSAKHVIDRGFDTDLRSGCALEVEAFARCFAYADAQEGATAFLEKRQPRFE